MRLRLGIHPWNQVSISLSKCSLFVSILNEENKRLHKVIYTLLFVASVAVILSLMYQEVVEECFETISKLISGNWNNVKELKKVISYTYNIGVTMFNMRQYDWSSKMRLQSCMDVGVPNKISLVR